MNRRCFRILLTTLCAALCAAAMLAPRDAAAAREIWTLEQLQHVGDNATTLSDSYTLMCDIDASATRTWNSGAGFLPIGTNVSRFTGTFNGSGHVIHNLKINRPGADYTGLFGYVDDGGSISDLGLDNATVYGNNYTGSLAGYQKDCTISRCYSTGAVSGTSSVGGLVGGNYSSISHCYSTGAVSGSSSIGGLVGDWLLPSTSDSFWDTQTSGQASSVEGTGKTTEEMQVRRTFTDAGWDFDSIWGMCEGYSGYPFLLAINGTAPIAAPDTYTATVNTALTVNWRTRVLANDIDYDCQNLSALLVSDVKRGTLSLQADGSFTYEPHPGFTGVDTFTYKAADGLDNSTPAQVALAVSNSAPVAAADSYDVVEDTPLAATAPGVLGNDSNPDNDTAAAELIVQAQHGTLVLNADGSFTYTPASGYRGTDSFMYRATDTVAASAAVTVTLRVGYDNAPAAAADAYSAVRNTPLSVAAPGVLANDSDPGSHSLTAALVTEPASGTLNLSPDGSFSYIPEDGFTGTASFTYTAFDGLETSAPATVAITVTSHALTAAADAYETAKNTPLTIDAAAGVLDNDTDALGHALIAVLVTEPASGSMGLNADGSFFYMPDKDFTGEDSFTYRVSDGVEQSAPATVTITVSGQCPAQNVLRDDYPRLAALRAFRDSTLAASAWGRTCIRLYYSNADRVNAALDRCPPLRTLACMIFKAAASMAGRN